MNMNICYFAYCEFICFITSRLINAVNANDKNVRRTTFKTEVNTKVLLTENTTDINLKSMVLCADICLLDHRCCLASFDKGTSTSRIDSSGRCNIETGPQEGWRIIRRNSYLPLTCPGCISFGDSLFSIFEETLGWEIATENCERLGGKLAELETSEENEFIKDELLIRNTGVNGYWIGGYNFHNDYDMEWVSQPNQPMIFNDMEDGEPNGPDDQLCMVMWKDFEFGWGDMQCYKLYAYVCEFVHR